MNYVQEWYLTIYTNHSTHALLAISHEMLFCCPTPPRPTNPSPTGDHISYH